MRENFGKTRILIRLLVTFYSIGFLSVVHAQTLNLQVNISLGTTQTELLATSVGSCTNSNHNGCVNVPRNKMARIHFSLTGDRKCNRPGAERWALSAIYLGGKDSPTKPSAWGSLDAEVLADFKVANAASGLLIPETGSSEQQITIHDANKSGYSIWYTVQATCVKADGTPVGDTIEIDPRIKNGGTG